MGTTHRSAVISSTARLGSNLSIGPFCVIEDDVEIGDRCQLAAGVVIKRGTRIGEGNEICEGAVLGGRPQHVRAGNQAGRLIVGDGNVIREYATLHCGLTPDTTTIVGSNNMIMVHAHVAHDCHIGDHTIIANNVMLAGHVTVDDRAYLSGAVAVHQFCRIGRLAMVGGQAHVNQDVPPYVTVDGQSSLIVGLNVVGLRRAGISSDEIRQLKEAYRLIYRSGLSWRETLAALQDAYTSGPAMDFLPFLQASQRGIIQARQAPHRVVHLAPMDDQGEAQRRVRKAG